MRQQIDCSKASPGKFTIEKQEYSLFKFNSISENCYIIFKECDLDIQDNFGTEFSPMHYIFDRCNVTFANISIHIDNEYSFKILSMMSGNSISCNSLKIWCKNVSLLTREMVYMIMKIKSNIKTIIIGDNVARQNVTNQIQILQKFFDTIYCYNINFPRKYVLNPSKIVLINCSGNIDGIKGLVNVSGDKTPYLDVLNDTTIYAEDFDHLDIRCDDKFNIFLKNPKDFKKITYQGLIEKTNCDIVDRYKKKLYKFKVFVNVDFTSNNFIQQFFNCKFYNCCFNENQMVLNSMIKKCHFLSNKENFVNCFFE